MTTTLNAAQARARLERMLQWQAAPALITAEVDDLFLMVPQITDADGVAPDDDDYVPTYSTYAAAFREAAATGWEWKAGKVAGEYSVATGGGTKFERQQKYDMCMQQAEVYGGGRRGGGSRLQSVRLNTVNTVED